MSGQGTSDDWITEDRIGPNRGYAAVESARGRLYYRLVFNDDRRLADACVLEPTEWKFLPDGPLAHALAGFRLYGMRRTLKRSIVAVAHPVMARLVRATCSSTCAATGVLDKPGHDDEGTCPAAMQASDFTVVPRLFSRYVHPIGLRPGPDAVAAITDRAAAFDPCVALRVLVESAADA